MGIDYMVLLVIVGIKDVGFGGLMSIVLDMFKV